VRDDPFTHNDGRTTRLLRAEGTVPIYYQGVKYNIPVKMFLPEGFPRAGPICYVTPTANMIIKPGHGLVDGGGLVRRDPSGEWRYPASALADFARHLADAFGVEPPLFAKPPGYEARPSPPAPQERVSSAYARNTSVGEYRREAAAANGDARGAPVPYRGRGQPPPPPPPGPGTREHARPGASSRYPSPPRSPRVVSQYPPQPGAQHGHAQHGHGPPPPAGAYPPPPPPPSSAAPPARA
jgi:ESCRT-I complex subunit TSG101